ncbi:MAG: dUTP diphosphatase [Prevotellaceae bacterium]|jgi:dUTP pyrophosphatase|nr:dUTP diphosphatase [Prevotellaceae bacterium]
MKVKIINKSVFDLPQYETLHAAGLDLRANIDESILLKPLQRALISTGIYIELPDGFEAQIRPRSGLAVKHGISLVNAPGTIDPDYRGEIKVVVVNLSDMDFELKSGERVAQMVIARFERIEWIQVNELSESDRGESGFGSTGRK